MTTRTFNCARAAMAAFVLSAILSAPAAACVEHASVGELTLQAERIVIGDVVQVTSAWNDGSTLITTNIVVVPTDHLKGAAQPIVPVRIIGGTVGDVSLVSTDTPFLREGDRVLLFLDGDRLVGGYQGAWLTDGTDAVRTDGGLKQVDEATLQPLANVLAEIEAASAPGAFPGAITAYDGEYELPIDDRYLPLPFDWTYMANPMGEDLELNGNCVDASAGPEPNQWSALFFGLVAWNDAGADFEFNVGGFTADTDDAFDGRNLVFFCPSGDCGMAPSTIAVTRLWFSGGDIVEIDMIFNDEDHTFWDGLTGGCGGDKMDIFAIAAHEFGHALGLDHSADASATMFASTSVCNLAPRTLESDDTDGLFAIYGPVSDPPSYDFMGEAIGDKFGDTVANAGDVDDDGDDDFIVGAPLNDENGLNAGKAYVYSGRTGALLYEFLGPGPDTRFGLAVSTAGDTNGDGHDDVIVSAPKYSSARGRVYVYSGADGSTLFVRSGGAPGDRFGQSVSGGVDINHDGYDDVIIGAPYNDANGNNAGRVDVYAGNTWTRIKRLHGEKVGDRFGTSVAAVGKMNGDSHRDFVVGAPLHNGGGKNNAGAVYAYSGADFSLLYKIPGLKVGDKFGSCVAGVGRMDGDSRDDFVASAPYWDQSGKSNRGRIDAFSGIDGDRLWKRVGQNEGDRLGYCVAGAGDVDDDGRDDVIAGAPWHDSAGSNAGRIYVRSGVDGSTLGSADGAEAGDRCGTSVAGLRDLDGDGEDEVLFGAPYDDSAADNAGRVFIGVSAPASFMGPLPDGRAVFAPAPSASDLEEPLEEPASGLAGATCPGDVDGSGAVDGLDYLELLLSWGPCAGACRADVNGDGSVNGLDVEDLVEAWGACE